jgi:multidrug efflux system membrane fusion protein
MSEHSQVVSTGAKHKAAKLAAEPYRAAPPRAEDRSDSSSGGPWRKIILLIIVLAVAGLIVWRIRSSNASTKTESDRATAQANRATPVQTAPVQQKTVPVYFTALGTVTAYNTVTVNSRVSGQLIRVNFREGQNVRKGELLMEIDPAPYKAAVDQAIGQLAKDQANLDNMKAEAERYTALYQAGVVSKEQRDLEVSNQGQAAGSIKADQAAIEAAKVNLAYCRIYSPIDGVVGLRQVDPGNIVNAGQTTGLVVLTQIHPIAVIFTLPEDQLPRVQRAMKAPAPPLTVEAYDRSDAHLIATGKLLTIDNQIDTTTGTAKLKAVFDNTDNGLFANQFVNVRLVLSQRPDAIVVPTAAISTGTQGDYVFVVNPGAGKAGGGAGGRRRGAGAAGAAAAGGAPASAAPAGAAGGADAQPRAQFHVDTVPVHVDFVDGTTSILADGALKPGQQVVVDGQEKLVDGASVVPQQPQGPRGPRGGGAAGAASPIAPGGSAAGGPGKGHAEGTPDAPADGPHKGGHGHGGAVAGAPAGGPQ